MKGHENLVPIPQRSEDEVRELGAKGGVNYDITVKRVLTANGKKIAQYSLNK